MSGRLEGVLAGHSICICAGSGGVGKTTTSAAIGVGMAARGLKVGVLTIDPAKRLADSLGLDDLGNVPRAVDLTSSITGRGGGENGELWAMMLDSKATFDDLINAYSPDEETRQRILDNRIYLQISGALAGSQEYMAMEKLYELHTDGEYDLLILDTPPSRNALDFLDAPQRVTQFIEGRAMRLFIKPTGFGARVAGRGFSVVSSVLRRLTGSDLIADLSEFFSAMAGLLGGFRERAERVEALLTDDATTFLVVTGPAGEPIEEAAYLRAKLAEGGLPFGGLVINRVHPLVARAGRRNGSGSTAGVLRDLTDSKLGLDPELAERVLEADAGQTTLADRDRANIDALASEAPEVPMIEVPELSDEIHDIDGLLALGRHLFDQPPEA